MNLIIREDSVEIEGYVNAVERNSKTLRDRFGSFIERICKGAFDKALKRNKNVRIMLNHKRDIGGVEDGNLELHEDSIGLHARATITDPEVVDDARKGNLVGWSFGFTDVPDGVERSEVNGIPLRIVKDLNLSEVSILNRQRSPAYEGTLVNVRDDEVIMFGEPMIDDVETTTTVVEVRDAQQAEPDPMPEVINIDYSKWESMIKEMKGETK